MSDDITLEAKSYLGDDGFGYGFVLTSKSGNQSFYIRNDRAILDWLFEPVPEEEFDSEIAYVELPEGYYYWGYTLFYGAERMPYGMRSIHDADTKLAVAQSNPVHDKALHVVLGSLELYSREVFEAAELPYDKIFFLSR